MKKAIYLIIAFLISGIFSIYSQSSETETNKLSVGIVGGINLADMYFPNSQERDDQEITALTRFGVGAVLDISVSKNLFLRLEPMYLQKGGKIEEGSDPVNQPEGMIKSSSVEIPVLAQFTFGKKINPFLIAGPTVGFNLNSDIEFDLTGLEFTGDMKDVTETVDLGLTFGGGIQLPLSIGKIFIEARYVYGFLNQRKNGTVILESNLIQIELPVDKEEDKYTNKGFQMILGFLIHL